jgi:hemolysin-activating ACP:hemolysin acyltransferase
MYQFVVAHLLSPIEGVALAQTLPCLFRQRKQKSPMAFACQWSFVAPDKFQRYWQNLYLIKVIVPFGALMYTGIYPLV